MSDLTDKMTAAISTLQSQHGVTTDQVNSIVAQANAPFIASLTAAINSEKDDATKIADINAALGEFTTAFAPTAPSAPAAPAPDSVAVTPTSAVAPAAAPNAAPAAPTA